MPLITAFITFICLLFIFLSAIVTDGLLAILAARQTPHWFGGPYNVACLGLRWFGGISSGLGNALCPFTKCCHGLVKNTLRWFGNGLCDILVHIQLRYDAQMQQMIEGQKYLKSELSARDQTINARDTTIAADKHHHQSALEAKDAKITQKDRLLTAARKEKNELLAEVSRKDTELADEKAGSMGQRAEIRILEHKLAIHSGKLPFSHDALEKSDALGMPEEEKMALELVLYKKETDRLQRQTKHSELAGASYKRTVKANSDLKLERDQQQKESVILRNELNVERAKNVGLEKHVVELEEAVEDGVDQVSNLVQHQNELREKLGASQDQNVNQQRDLLHAQGMVTDTRDENERLQDLAADRLKQLGLAGSTNARLQVEIYGAENAKTELEGQLNGAMKTNTLLQGKVLGIQGQLDSTSEAKTQLESKVLDIQSQLDGTLKTKAQLESKVLNIQGQLNAAIKTKAQLESRVNDTQGKLNATKTQLLSQVHNVEANLDGAHKTNAKLLRQSEKDEKNKSKLKTALRKASLKLARLQKKMIKGRIVGFRKSTKASKEDRDGDWKDVPGSDNDDDGDNDDKGNSAPATTPSPSPPRPSTPPPSTPPPSTPPSSPSSCDDAPPSCGNALGPSGDDSILRPTGSDSSTASSEHPSLSPTQDNPSHLETPVAPKGNIEAPPEENVMRNTSNDESIAAPGLPTPSPAQDAAPSSVGNSTNDESPGATVDSCEIDGTNTLPMGSSGKPSPSPARDATPSSIGNFIDKKSPEATVKSCVGDDVSTVPIDSSDIPAPSPIQDATPENNRSSGAKIESREVNGASNVPVCSSANPSLPPAQDAALLSAGNSANDGSSGATVECHKEDVASNVPVGSSENSSPLLAQDAAPSSAGSSVSDKSLRATFGRRQGDSASTVPVNSSSPATITASPKTETSQSNGTPEPINPLRSTAAQCIVDPNLFANNAPSVGNPETSEPDDGSKSTTLPPSNKAEPFVNDHKATTTPSTGDVEASQANDISKPTTPLSATRDQCLFDIKSRIDSAPLASTEVQAGPIDAALVPLPESPTALPANLVRSQDFEERLQANYAQHGLPNIDDEGLGEGEREDLAREKLDGEDEEQEVDQGALDTHKDNVWRSEEEDVDMEDFDGNPPCVPAKPDEDNQQAPASRSNLDSQTCPAATDDDLDSLFEGDDSMDYLNEGDEINVDRDDEDFYGSHTTKSQEPTLAAGNDSENKPEVNVEMGEAGPLESNPDSSNAQGNAGPVATPQQAPSIPPSQLTAPTSAPASTSPEFGTMSPYSGYNYTAVLAKAGGEDPAPASSTSSQINPGSVPPAQPSTAPLYCPKPAFSTPSRNAPQTSSSTSQPASPFGLRLTPEERQRGPSGFRASPSPSALPWLNPRTTPTAPRSGSFFGAMAQSTNPPTTPSQPPSLSSSSSGSESEQPAATGSSSTADPSAPSTPAVPNGQSNSSMIPGLFQVTPCDYGKKIDTHVEPHIEPPTKERKIVPLKPRRRQMGQTGPSLPLPPGASNTTSNYSTIINSDGKKVEIPKDDDEFEDFVLNEVAKETEARDAPAANEAQAGSSNSQPPNPDSSTTDPPFASAEQMAVIQEIMHTLSQELKARLRATSWPEVQFRPRSPNYNPLETDFRFSYEEHMARFAQATAFDAQTGQPSNGANTGVRRIANTPPKKRKI